MSLFLRFIVVFVGLIKKCFWTLFSLASFGALMWHMYSITSSYFAYKVAVNVKVRIPQPGADNKSSMKHSIRTQFVNTSIALYILKGVLSETRKYYSKNVWVFNVKSITLPPYMSCRQIKIS